MPSPPIVAYQEFDGTNFWPPAGAGGGLQYWSPLAQASWVSTVIGIGTLCLQRFDLQAPGVFRTADCFITNSWSATNAGSSNAQTLSFTLGVYTKNQLTLSLATSGSYSTAFTVTGSSSSASYQGFQAVPVPIDLHAMAPGNYWVGYIYSSASAGHAVLSAPGQVVASVLGGQSVFKGIYGSGSGVSNVYDPGVGSYSVTTAALPASIGFSELLSQIGATARPAIAFKNFIV